MELYRYVSVLVDGFSQPYFYICGAEAEPGTAVLVPFGETDTLRQGIVQSVGLYTAEDAPYPVNRTKRVVRILTPEEYAEGRREPELTDEERREFEYVDSCMEQGDIDEVFFWASDHQNAADRPATTRKVVVCYEWCIQKGMPEAATNLGAMYYKGAGVPQNYQTAAQYYGIAARAGERRAMCNLGYCYYYGRHQAVDYAEAYRWFSGCALLYNDANSLYKLGDMFLAGHGVEKNEICAFRLYKRAAEALDADAGDAECIADVMLRLGECALRGTGCPRNAGEALGWLHRALEGFYARRGTDPFAQGLIRTAKERIAEATALLDGEKT